jgi:hypothetical protein
VISSIGAGVRPPGRSGNRRRAEPIFHTVLGDLAGAQPKVPVYLTGVASWAWALRHGRVRRSMPSPRTSPLAKAGRAFDQLPLFRPEAMAARRTRWLGRPQVSQPWPVRAVAVGSLIATAALACLVAFGGYTGRVTVQGVVAPTAGVIRVTAPAAGRVEALEVREGEIVNEGQLLYRLALDSMTPVGPTQAQIERLMTVQRRELEDEIARQRDIAGKHKAELATRLTDLRREAEWPRDRCVTCPRVICRRSKSLYSRSSAYGLSGPEAVEQRALYRRYNRSEARPPSRKNFS